MILDLQSMFSGTVAADGTKAGQAITATAISTNVIDLRQPNGAPTIVDNGIVGQDLYFLVQTLAAFNTLTSLTITLESDSTANLATAPVVHFSTGAILLAALTANTVLARVQVPSGSYKRFLGVRYTVGGANPTLGTVLANLVDQPQRNIAYPSGFTIDV